MKTSDLIILIGVSTGFVGALSALISSLASYQSFRRDGYIVKVRGKRGWKIMNAVPPYSEEKNYSVITVYNRGTRPANISQVGESYLYQFGGGIYSDSMIYGTTRIDDDGARDYLAEEKPDQKRPVTGYYYATTKSGKTIRSFPYTRIVYYAFYLVRKTRQLITNINKLSKSSGGRSGT